MPAGIAPVEAAGVVEAAVISLMLDILMLDE